MMEIYMEMKSDGQADTNRSDSELLETYNYGVVEVQALYGKMDRLTISTS